jgi:hypothetical protein
VSDSRPRQFITVEDLGLPPLPEIKTPPSEWHPLNGAPGMRAWCEAAIKAGAFAGSAISGRALGFGRDDDGPA